ncbi:hypothetical protein [Marinilactibacillus sp. Marseille-P9653]|uniref:hypothetical protein n=1 Tax=Marinilactibacillus sp. Marseille-P9653 TaxID=2866583 RepID=UPI001CE3D8D1|nr:hypothetical protein [Marinilactibacillus sp. Marseille-P9653]
MTNSRAERRIQYTAFMHPFSKSFDIIVKQTNNEFPIEEITKRSINPVDKY